MVNSGLLQARVDDTAPVLEALGDGTLDTQTFAIGSHSTGFHIDPTWREKLINGWDDIDLTQSHASAIAQFRDRRAQLSPRLFEHEQTST